MFVLRHGRRHRSAEEYEGRRQVYQENKAKVAQWNDRSDAHKCAHLLNPNHYRSPLHSLNCACLLLMVWLIYAQSNSDI